MTSNMAPGDPDFALRQKIKKGLVPQSGSGQANPETEDMAYVKSGWLLRQSTILKRWKKNWFDLWTNGYLIYYSDQEREDLEDRILMQLDCIDIRVGNACKDIHLPEGKSKDCCLQIICHEGKVINLIAESTDDCLAWETALRDARTKTNILPAPMLYDEGILGPAPPYTQFDAPPPYGYDQYPGTYPIQGSQVIYTRDGQAYTSYPYTAQGPGATNHIIIRERYYNNDGDMAMGMLAGAATGMALGSLFWGF